MVGGGENAFGNGPVSGGHVNFQGLVLCVSCNIRILWRPDALASLSPSTSWRSEENWAVHKFRALIYVEILFDVCL